MSKIYPLKSPNGSTIIVYGHEQGLRILWRGGKPLKQLHKLHEQKPKVNGTSNDEIVIIDSDDEQEAAKLAELYMDNPVFEEEEEEYDASRPFEPIIQELDLPLGVETLHLSFPHLPSELHRTTWKSMPKLLSTNIVVAAACSDSSVRILSIPIIPPSPQSIARPELSTRITVPHPGKGPFGEEMLILSSTAGHQSIPKGVSITLTSQILHCVEDVDMADDDRDKPQSQARDSSRSRSRSRSRLAGGESSWEFLVASQSDDLSGLLLIHRVPFTGDTIGTSCGPQEQSIPWRIQTLASPATCVSFNHSLFPAARHSQLIVAESQGAVRIIDCKAQSDLDQASWLFSLYPSFQCSTTRIPTRKKILDAQWVLSGKAIVVLLADGEWGIWDVDNTGPKGNTEVKRAPSGGASLAFAISGWVGSTPISNSLKKSPNGGRKEYRSGLAPMTPGTRKVRQEALFSGPTTTAIQGDGPSRGGLSVSPIHHSSNSKVDDESLLLWYGDSIKVIPSLFTHWQNKVKGSGNLFGVGVRGQAKEYNNIHLGGQVRNHVSLFPQHIANHGGKADADMPSEILVTGEHNIVIVGPPLKSPITAPAVPLQSLSKPTPADQHLLSKGELDVDGMDRILDGMSNGHGEDHRNGTTPKRKVDFLSL